MNTRRATHRLFSFALSLLLCTAALPSQAGVAQQPGLWHSEFLRVQQGGVSRDQAAAKVKRRFGGKILAISEVQRNGRSMYRIKGLSDKSQVYVVYVDKRTGRISR
ncbi:PepSY domain-containing protein [Microbulbifer halophilus]|uniref:PepSY domain-containing protein n=1 Tax=Microbulbifer halophilus TaxID=453963 RepID=A0ABW5EDH0_9GAMM|nr:PepSY domain-containing protein [Microbulbifer halophilus]MCW8127021.1 PepSY domain-containing protein [Microbulbifer halophilus]